MKRDLELVRTILLAMEAVPADEHPPNPFQIDSYSDAMVGHHVHLMGTAGLLKTANTTTTSDMNSQAMPLEVTWAGHDFIDTMRSQEVWEQTKQALKDAGGGGFSIMLEFGKKVAEGFMKKKLKDLTGLEV
jgi:hypothetical protein